jgi:hypothetical protein
MIVRLIYLPHSLSEASLPDSEKKFSDYFRNFTSKIIDCKEKSLKRRADFSLKRGNILIVKSECQLTLFDGNKPVRQFPVAIGKPATPTPAGKFSIAAKITNPGGALGTRWMGLNFDAYGIHGTNKPWLIGKMVSHGCIRMHNSHAEELYVLVKVGTPVYIRD